MAAAELQTPKMQPHQPSPRNTPTRYRREIEQVKTTIASMEKDLTSLQAKIKLRNDQFETANLTDPALAIIIMQQMTLETQEVLMTREQLILDKQRLVQLEEKLRRVKEGAEKSARYAMFMNYLKSNILRSFTQGCHPNQIERRVPRQWIYC